jgi:excinuclease ABC subunit A
MPKSAFNQSIRLRGVRQNNLKGFDLNLPLNKLTVLTGVSGSGKSSLAFDTLFAEGQRRYIETFSPYARQFFDRMDKPRVDRIEGIPPAIALEQRNTVRTTRSTVGTMTEICDHLKVVWPRLAKLHCRNCGRLVRKDTPQSIWSTIPEGAEILIVFELPLSDKLTLSESLTLISGQGYQRLLIDFEQVRVEDAPARLNPTPESLTVIQDRLHVKPSSRSRFVEACEQAYHFGKNRLAIHFLTPNQDEPLRFSQHLHCAHCNIEYRQPSPALFSFNHPLGACPTCRGFGRIISIDYQRALPDQSVTLAQGVVRPWQTGQGAECQQDMLRFCRKLGVPVDVPFRDLPSRWQQWVIEGDPLYGQDQNHEWPKAWYGLKGYFRWLESKAYKMHVRVLLSRYRAYSTCPECRGQRLQPDALLYRTVAKADTPQGSTPDADDSLNPDTNGITLADVYAKPIQDALAWFQSAAERLGLEPSDPAAHALHQVRSRLQYLVNAGLGYLTLDRPTRTLSGGETQRVNLTSCLGTRLVNTLYILDEPSVGLHPRDTNQLVRILLSLRDLGNTVVVVEHEPTIIRHADRIVDLGPAQGKRGGQIVFQGSYPQLLKNRSSLTGRYLSGRAPMPPPPRRPVHSQSPRLSLRGANTFNLKNLSVQFPLKRLVCVSGVSGSGKTTLVREVLYPALSSKLLTVSPIAPKASPNDSSEAPLAHSTISSVILDGIESIGAVVIVDQSPLARTPRSNPAVYTGAFDDIRTLFAQSTDARKRGLTASSFSFNSAQGQCQRCRGAGFEKIEMQFLSDVFTRCPDCHGRRYRPHVLEVKLQPPSTTKQHPDPARRHSTSPSRAASSPPSDTTWSIADVLEATVDEAVAFLNAWQDSTAARRAIESLQVLQDVGLGYLTLGQAANSLSGGECQRLKLAGHLTEFRRAQARHTKPTLLIFDEPTTGLHFEDIRLLLGVFHRLVDAGHSLIVIEHNIDVILSADWVIDLGPGAGAQGGQLVAEGTPESISSHPSSHTGHALLDSAN